MTTSTTSSQGTGTKMFAYVRVSGKAQVEGDGFRRQEAEIQAYAKANGLDVVEVYREEGISGTASEADRPAFQDMVTAILRNGVRTVVVEGLDRVAREYRVQELLLTYLASKGIALIVARTGENVTEALMADPMRRALVQMQGVLSELEKNMLVKKLRQARDRKREEQGRCEGRHAFTKETLPDALRSVLEAIRRLRRRKPGQVQCTYAQVAEELNRQGHTSSKGLPFTGANVQNLWQRYRRLI